MYSNKSRSPAPYYPTNLVQAYTHAEQAYISDIFIFSTRVNMKLTIMSRRKSLHDDLPKINPSDVGFLAIFVVWSFISNFHVLLSFCTPFFLSHFFRLVKFRARARGPTDQMFRVFSSLLLFCLLLLKVCACFGLPNVVLCWPPPIFAVSLIPLTFLFFYLFWPSIWVLVRPAYNVVVE